jgi:hypothetical protein
VGDERKERKKEIQTYTYLARQPIPPPQLWCPMKFQLGRHAKSSSSWGELAYAIRGGIGGAEISKRESIGVVRNAVEPYRTMIRAKRRRKRR